MGNYRCPFLKNIQSAIILLSIFSMGSITSFGQEVIQARGIDQSVDYSSLKAIGPWDDRNYEVTTEDLALLAPNESELRDPIPVFFRILMRKANPQMRKEGPAQYPRSALQIFRQNYKGYLVNGNFYRKLKLENGEFKIMMEEEKRIGYNKNNSKVISEVRVTTPNSAAESAIKIHPLDANIVIAGSNGPGSGQKMHYSSDGGLNWTQVSLPLGGTCCDPTVDYSANGEFAYTATLGNCGNSLCVWFYRSDDNGVTWTGLSNVTPGDPRRELTTSGSDKEYIHVDKHCGSPHVDNIYMTWHDNNIMQFARSTDKGNTWSKTSFSADPLGIGSDITTDHNGNVYYVWPEFNSRSIRLKKSTDGGATFASGTTTIASTQGSYEFPVPAMDKRKVFIYASVDADLSGGAYHGSIYASWTDSYAPTGANPINNHSRIQVAYSRNQGATWSTVTPHSTADQSTVDRFHQWLAVGQDGTVHLVFYDTRESASRTGVDLYYTSSTDGAQTFSAPQRLTTVTSAKINDSFEYGDYNGLDHVVRQSSIFTDNRVEGGGGGDDIDVYSTTDINPSTVNVNPFPRKPSSIAGPTLICPNQINLNYSVPTTTNASSYDWSVSDNSVTVTGNGNSSVFLNGITSKDTITVWAQNTCGNSAPTSFIVDLAPASVCNVSDCIKENLNINSDTISIADIFDVINSIESDATISAGNFKAFRAGNEIELNNGFTVEQSSVFLAEIESCAASLLEEIKK